MTTKKPRFSPFTFGLWAAAAVSATVFGVQTAHGATPVAQPHPSSAQVSEPVSEVSGTLMAVTPNPAVTGKAMSWTAAQASPQPGRAPVPPRPATVTATVQFRVVSSSDFRAIPGARVVIIGPDGRFLHTALTDTEGISRVSVTVPRDPRFPDLGFVTALCVANGHNETVVFDVPVRQGTVQPVTLNPIQPGLRNEPTAMLGQIHRLDVIDFVNRYGAALGLQRQTPIPGEQGYAPFGPQLRAR